MKATKAILHTIKLTVFMGSISYLAACGGGAGGEEENTQVQPTSTPQPTIEDLTVSPDNTLLSIHTLEVDASSVVPENERAYLSICEGEISNKDVISMKYEDCLLRSPITDTSDLFQLSLPNHVDNLIAVIWYYDVTQTPFIARWEKSEAQNAEWVIN